MEPSLRTPPVARSNDSDARKRAVLGASAPFATLGPDALADVARRSTLVRTARRRPLFSDGDEVTGVFVVGAGRVRLVRPTRGAGAMTVGYRGPGDLLGEDEALAAVNAHLCAAWATENVDAVRVPARSFARVLESSAPFANAIARIVQARRGEVEARLHALVSRTVESRLAGFLVEAEARYGVPESRGALIGARFTHQEIAEWIGATRETVTLTLGDWRRRGIILLDHRRVVVLDLRALRALV